MIDDIFHGFLKNLHEAYYDKSFSCLEDIVSKNNIKLFDNNGNYRSTIDILKDMKDVWKATKSNFYEVQNAGDTFQSKAIKRI